MGGEDMGVEPAAGEAAGGAVDVLFLRVNQPPPPLPLAGMVAVIGEVPRGAGDASAWWEGSVDCRGDLVLLAARMGACIPICAERRCVWATSAWLEKEGCVKTRERARAGMTERT